MSKFYDWTEGYGKLNEHNRLGAARPPAGRLGTVQAIVDFHAAYPPEGYRRLTFMMMDAEIVAVSPSHGVSGAETGRLVGTLETRKEPSKGQGFQAAARAPHEHWHFGHQLRHCLAARFLLPD